MSEVVIVGGGITGLATALSVARHGHHVTVLERAERFSEIGAGIQIAPNGLHALDLLGVGKEVRARAVPMDELRFMDAVTSEHVMSMTLTEAYQQRFGNPYVVVHRDELHTQLLEACRAADNITLHAESAATGYEQEEGRATVVLADGKRFSGDAVIGADGINSAIRGQLIDDGAPRVLGLTVYRSQVIPMDQVPQDLRMTKSVAWWAGPGWHLVQYPISGGKYLNLAASSHNGVADPIEGVPVSQEHLRKEFSGMGADASRLMELGSHWKAWALVDRDPAPQWADGRVVLAGDAAHPMLHYAAQGACQGLEDAVVLGDLLDCASDEMVQRLEKFTAQRRDRTAAVQLTARESIRLWHPAGAAAEARNALLTSLDQSVLHDYVAWMHGERQFASMTTSVGAFAGA